MVCFVTILCGVTNYFVSKEALSVLTRNPPGMGSKIIVLEAWTEDEKYPVNIQVNERTYEETELETVFQKGIEWLEGVWLGENTSEDSISRDLYFPTYIDTLGLHVRWEPENYRWIQSDGKITEDGFEAAPQKMEIRAILSYGEVEKSHVFTITLVAPETERNGFQGLLNGTMETLTEENTTMETLILPTQIDGKEITWHKQQTVSWPQVFLFGNMILILLYFAKEEKKIQMIKDRNTALNQDYPEIVYELVVLVSAGMTVRSAWEKVIEVYEREKAHTGVVRLGYEEMAMTIREMNYGISEIKAYENFGKRCGGQNYMRLAELLIQQVKRGARGMNQLLMREVTESEIVWRENSRRRAEEAGTKLLLPMVLLMMVVFAVLMIPAFLSMSI